MEMFFELSRDNCIEIVENEMNNCFSDLSECIKEIKEREYNNALDTYDNKCVAEIIGKHNTLKNLRFIRKRWDCGFDYNKDPDILKCRGILSRSIDKLRLELMNY